MRNSEQQMPTKHTYYTVYDIKLVYLLTIRLLIHATELVGIITIFCADIVIGIIQMRI